MGTRWFRYACEQRGVEADATFKQLLSEHLPQLPRGPFAFEARARAGFSTEELDWLRDQDVAAAGRGAGS